MLMNVESSLNSQMTPQEQKLMLTQEISHTING